MAKISKDTALAEITLRKYEKPAAKDRELVKRLCLSIGLIQTGDSRDIIVDILYVLLKKRKELSLDDIKQAVTEERKKHNLEIKGIAESNIGRQLRRLRELFLVEKIKNNYRITENLSLTEIMEEKLERYLIPSIIERVKEHFKEADKEFLK